MINLVLLFCFMAFFVGGLSAGWYYGREFLRVDLERGRRRHRANP